MRGFLGVVFGASLAGAFAPANAQEGVMERAAWLSGCWEQRAGGRVTTEMWMPPAGGLMVGGSRTVQDGTVRELEHLRLRVHGDTLVYTAIPSGQRETDFRSTSVSTDALVFENPTHDFPRRITYRRASPDSVVATVAGPGPGGAMRSFDIAMARASCMAPSGER
jgi:hypothetical protein